MLPSKLFSFLLLCLPWMIESSFLRKDAYAATYDRNDQPSILTLGPRAAFEAMFSTTKEKERDPISHYIRTASTSEDPRSNDQVDDRAIHQATWTHRPTTTNINASLRHILSHTWRHMKQRVVFDPMVRYFGDPDHPELVKYVEQRKEKEHDFDTTEKTTHGSFNEASWW